MNTVAVDILDRDESIQFEVEVDGRPVKAQIGRACLEEKFGLTESLEEAGADWYAANRARIDPVVAGKAHRGDTQPIIVTAADF